MQLTFLTHPIIFLLMYLLVPHMIPFYLWGICSKNYETWNSLQKARTEGRLFSELKWPRDAELVCSIINLPFLLSGLSLKKNLSYWILNYIRN